MFRAIRRPLAGIALVGSGTLLIRKRERISAKELVQNQTVAVTPLEPEVTGSAPIHQFKIKVYGYNGCPFCGKVRAFLDYYGFEYEDVEVNPLTKKPKPVPGYSKVPIVEVITLDGNSTFIKDSAVAISVLEECIATNKSEQIQELVEKYFTVNEKGKEEVKEDIKFGSLDNLDRKFIDEKVLHTVAPNIYPNYNEARKNCYMYMDMSDTWRNTWGGASIAEVSAVVMTPIAGRKMKKWADHEGQSPREYLYSSAEKFLNRKGDNRFLGGDNPSTADIEAYGVLCTMKGTQAMEDLASTKPVFYQWFLSVENHVQTHRGRF